MTGGISCYGTLPVVAPSRTRAGCNCTFWAGLRFASSDVSADPNQVQIEQFPCLSDNYGYLIHDAASGLTAAIDTPEVCCKAVVVKQDGL